MCIDASRCSYGTSASRCSYGIDACRRACATRQRGVTLIELVVFIIIISVGVVGLVSVTGSLTRNSADPMIRKQAIAIAESLLLEIEQRPFTFCVPGDRNTAATSSVLDATATDPAKCWDAVESMGPETGESRYSSSAPFNNVNDYNNFSMGTPSDTCTGICPLGSATKIDALDGYVAAASIALAGTTLGLADNSAALKITVTVTGRGENVSLVGYRTRYAPNAGG